MIQFKVSGQLDKELKRIAAYVPNAAKAGNEAVGKVAVAQLDKNINRVYRQSNASVGRKKNVRARTGNLRRAPQPPVVSARGMKIGFAGPAASAIRNWPGGYLQRRSKMGVDWHPKQQKTATIDYIGDTETFLETHAAAVFEGAFERELKIK